MIFGICRRYLELYTLPQKPQQSIPRPITTVPAQPYPQLYFSFYLIFHKQINPDLLSLYSLRQNKSFEQTNPIVRLIKSESSVKPYFLLRAASFLRGSRQDKSTKIPPSWVLEFLKIFYKIQIFYYIIIKLPTSIESGR
jgi:hypothetical protein